MKSKVIPVTDLSGIAPKSVLLFERIHYGWLHPRMIDFLQRDHGARFTVLTPRNKVAEERGRQLSGDGLIVYSEDIDAGIDARAFSEKEERDIADRNEREYSVAYLRDLVQQERWISTFFVGYAQNSFFAQFQPPPLPDLRKKINHYFDVANRLFDERGIDCVIGWPSYSLFTAVATHVAMTRGVPGFFLAPGRRDFRLMWSDGPYVSPRLLRRQMDGIGEIDSDSGTPKLTPPSDTQRAIAELDSHLKLSTYTRRFFDTSRDYLVWSVMDRLKPRNGERRPYRGEVRRIVSDWILYNHVHKISNGDIEDVTSEPFIFFPLPYEPEFPNTSLAREFNDTLAFVKQTALSMPASHRLVVKEHVVGVGHRQRSFYEEMRRFPNIVLANNSIRGVDLVERCSAVVTLNGTAGLEAAYAGKKAVLFSPNVEYAQMRHVRVVERMKDLPGLLREAIEPVDEAEQQRMLEEVRRHYQAVSELTVDVSNVAVFGGTEPALPQEEYDKLFRLLLQTYEFLSRPDPVPAHRELQPQASG